MKSINEAMKSLQLLKENKYDFSEKENIKQFINELPYKDAVSLYKELVPDKYERSRGNKKLLSLDIVDDEFDEGKGRLLRKIFLWFLYNCPRVIYHYTTIEKYKRIKKENLLEVNNENLICCTGKNDFMNFENNPNIVRLQIDVTRLPEYIFVRRRDKDDKNNVDFEDEWVIDFSNSKRNGLKLDELGLFKIEFSSALENNNEISNKLRKDLEELN